MSTFENKTVWIIGASSGIGKALVEELDKKNVRMILSSRKVEALETLRKQLREPEKHEIIPVDLANSETIESAVNEVKEKRLKIDFLFNNGGISQRSEAEKTSLEVDRKIFEVNYFGNIYLTKLVLPLMKANNGGHIVITASIAGKFGFFLRSAYSATKHALQGFYESLRLEVEKYHIKVTLIYPGKINTPISLSALNGDGTAHGVMDHNQETGMPAEICAQKMLEAVEKDKKEVLIGGKELWGVYLKKLLPQNIYWKIMKKQSAV